MDPDNINSIMYSKKTHRKIKYTSTAFASLYWAASMGTMLPCWPMVKLEVVSSPFRWKNVHYGNSSINTV